MGYNKDELATLVASYGNTYNVGSGISTTSTTSSTAAVSSDAGDGQDYNVDQINNIRIDVDGLYDKFSDLITTLRERNLIPRP